MVALLHSMGVLRRDLDREAWRVKSRLYALCMAMDRAKGICSMLVGYCNIAGDANRMTPNVEQAMYLDVNHRAELGIDGNCGFALVGPNIQEGEVEFVEIPTTTADPDSMFVRPKGEDAAKLWACKEALRRLRSRLNAPNMSYYFGNSHPYGA